MMLHTKYQGSVSCGIRQEDFFHVSPYKCKEGKDQESIQSSTTPDPRHHMGKGQNTRKHHTHESQEVSPFPAGEHKSARSRQDSIIKTSVKHI